VADSSVVDDGNLGATAMPPAVDGVDVRWALPSVSDRLAHPDRGAPPTTVQRLVGDLSPEQAEFARVHGLTDEQLAELGLDDEQPPTETEGEPPGYRPRDLSGVPRAPEGYNLELGGGYVVQEEERPILAEYLAVAHQVGLTQQQNKAVLRAYYENERVITDARATEDQRIQDSTERTLRSEWGERFEANMRGVTSAAERVFGRAMAEKILYGRLDDGTPIGSSPAVLKALLRLANS
jgi:hypothetical protein